MVSARLCRRWNDQRITEGSSRVDKSGVEQGQQVEEQVRQDYRHEPARVIEVEREYQEQGGFRQRQQHALIQVIQGL